METFTSETDATADLLETLVPKQTDLELMLIYDYTEGGIGSCSTYSGKMIVFMKAKSDLVAAATIIRLTEVAKGLRKKSDKEMAAFLSAANGGTPLPAEVFNPLADKCNIQTATLVLLFNRYSL